MGRSIYILPGSKRPLLAGSIQVYRTQSGQSRDGDKPRRISVVELSNKCIRRSFRFMTPHPEYLTLGRTPEERQRNYRTLFFRRVDVELFDDIRTSTNKGLAFGNDRFKKEIEPLTGMRVMAKKRGRLLGWRKENI